MLVEPLPFTLSLPGRDTLNLQGARSIWHRVLGLLHFDGETVTLEWSATRHLEQVSLSGVRVQDDAEEPTLLDLPLSWIAEARVTGGWWAPRFRLRGRRLDAFDGVPGAGLGTLILKVARRDRAIARAMAASLAAARTLGPADSPPPLAP